MPVTPVSLGPALRAWSDAGLTHLLLEGSLEEFEAAAAERSAMPGAFVASPAAPLPEKPPVYEETAAPFSEEAAATASAAQASSPRPGSSSPRATRSAPPAPAALAFSSGDGLPRDPSEWPEPWRGWFAKTSPATVLWTYHELGADVTGIGKSVERSEFFKNLINELGLPKGSSVFWPSAMPGSLAEPALVPNTAVFASGLRLLSPRLVVVFGDAALVDMELSGKVGMFGQVMIEGKLLVLLPGIEELLRGDAQRSSAVSLLRALFSTVNSI